MNLTERPASALSDPHERAVARLAMRAALDAYYGGAKALVLLRRLERSPNYHEYAAAVDSSYHVSRPPTADFTPYECPECGWTCLGWGAANEHCAPQGEDNPWAH